MESLIWTLSVFSGVLVLFCIAILIALLKSTSRIIEINKQLLILVAGKESKPEALRALVASAKPPQGKLKGIATGKKKKDEKKPVNTDYTLTVGDGRGL